MTFDEASKEIIDYEFDEFATYVGDSCVITTSSIEIMLNKLREEYAPTIEMTKEQYKILASSRNNAVNRVDKVGLLEFMSTYALLDLEIGHLRLMQAWLHPETIKVIGDEHDN